MDRKQKLRHLQRYLANIAIGPTTLRKQGPPGVRIAAIEFLAKKVDLRRLRGTNPRQYTDVLDGWTKKLMRSFPRGARRNFGAARKALNLFMVQAYFNRELAAQYGLRRFANFIETPLDLRAASKIRRRAQENCGRHTLPRWQGIKNLAPQVSQQYQVQARKLAKQWALPRGELDIVLWPADNR
jgi:hypothetical protein